MKSLVRVTKTHVKILSDNTTTVHAISKMGTSHSKICNQVAYEIWDLAISKAIWISATHLLGKYNIETDEESRKEDTQLEWKLSEHGFIKLCSALSFKPEIDLFASRLNYQLKPFVSYRPDPETMAVNSFLMNWRDWKFYAFPPFSIVSKTLQKVYFDNAEGILIVPDWPNQPWFPLITQMQISKPFILPPSKDLLYLPNKTKEIHPMYKKLQLLACHISAKR